MAKIDVAQVGAYLESESKRIQIAQVGAYLETESKRIQIAQVGGYIEILILNYEQPSAGDDAVYTDGDTGFDPAPNTLYPGGNAGGGTGALNSMIVFNNVQVPQGATIEDAYITFTASDTDSSGTVNATLTAIDEDSPDPPTSYTEVIGKNKTVTYVNWADIQAWTAENNYDSPSITDIIQEIINRTGWETGNTIIILVEDDASTTAALRKAYSSADAGKKPTLTIKWQATSYQVGSVVLNPISNPPPLDDFTVTWGTAINATDYELQEQENEGDWVVVYTGANQSFNANDRAPGIWSYRVRGKNGVDYGPFSSVQSTGIDQPLSSRADIAISL